MYTFVQTGRGEIDIEGPHDLELLQDIDAACVAQANLAGELLKALQGTLGVLSHAREVAMQKGHFALEEAIAAQSEEAAAAIAKAAAL